MTDIRSTHFNTLECAFQVLFSQSFTDSVETSDTIDFLQEESTRSYHHAKVRMYVEGVTAHQSILDATIENYLRNWTLSRLHRIDLVLLRLGVYALGYAEGAVPALVLDDIIELAKLYGTDNSYRFVNAVLDRYYKQEVASS